MTRMTVSYTVRSLGKETRNFISLADAQSYAAKIDRPGATVFITPVYR